MSSGISRQVIVLIVRRPNAASALTSAAIAIARLLGWTACRQADAAVSASTSGARDWFRAYFTRAQVQPGVGAAGGDPRQEMQKAAAEDKADDTGDQTL